jgi:eukaryotic-like serine/threonine-protein kinase
MLRPTMEGAPVEFRGSERFVLVRRLGEGGMGIVYEAIDRARGLHVALKTLRDPSPEMLLRLKNEFRALHELHHANLVSLGELVGEAGRWFFTMELVDGVDVVRWVRPGGVLDEARLRAVLPQLVGALYALHRVGNVHRDVKPSNVMVTPAGRVVLLDFGLTTRVAVDDTLSDGTMVGSVDYMAPEQANGGAVGPAADWYAMGVVLFEALTGRLPFFGSPMDIVDHKLAIAPPAVASLAPGAPADLAELCDALLRREPAARPSGRQLAQRFAIETPRADEEILPIEPPFVGRQAELAMLRQAFDDARAEGSVTVFVQGESGLGKSALVAQLVRSLVEDHPDALILEGRCYERELAPFKGFDGIVDALTRRLAELGDAAVEPLLPVGIDALVRVFPVLGRVRAIARRKDVTIDEDARRQRQRAFVALRELLARLAEQQPVVLVLEDFQWADEDSLALRREIMRGRDLPGRLLVATLRSQPGTRDFLRRATLSAVDDPGEVRELQLGPLSGDESLRLVGEFVGAERLARIDAAALVREGHGHPLFLTQLAHRALEPGAAAAPDLPAALWERVREQPDEARRLIEIVSLAGGAVTQDVAARAAGLDAAALARATASLRAGHLVRTTGSRLEDVIEPYHDQIRAAVLDHLPPPEQQLRHRALAEALGRRAHADAHALHLHWLGAGDHARAAATGVSAAADADALLAFDRAAQLWQRTVELADSDEERRLRLRRLGEAFANGGRPRQAIEAYRAAATLEAGDARVELWRRAAELLLSIGEVDEGIALLQQVLEAVGMRYPSTPRRAQLALLFERARLRLRGLDFRERPAAALSERARVRIDTAFAAGETLSMVDHVRGADFQTRGLLWALEAGEPYRVGRAITLEAAYSCAFGTRGAARTAHLLGEARRLVERTRNPHLVGLVACIDAIAASMEGRFAAAVDKMPRAESLLRACPGSQFELATAQFFHVMALAMRGELRTLDAVVKQWRADAVDRGDLYTLANLANGYANLCWLAAGDPVTARAQATETMSRWSQRGFFTQHFYMVLALANVDLYEGDGAGALRRVEELWRGLRGSLLDGVQFLRISALDLRARAALAAARTSPAPALMRALTTASAALLEEEDAPWATALAALARAQLDRSAAALLRAADVCEHAGLLGRAAAARRAAGIADDSLDRQGVRDPQAWVRLWCPAPVGAAP